MSSNPPHSTTHTVEMDQINVLNARLSDPAFARRPSITAADLQMTGICGLPHAAGPLTEDAVLLRLCWDGPPAFPNVHGHFAAGPQRSWVVDLHTTALLTISHRLNTRQKWGVNDVS